VGLSATAPDLGAFWNGINRAIALALVAAYFIGFATPRLLKRAWQVPELERFLEATGRTPARDLDDHVANLEEAVSSALGGPSISILLWDEERAELFRPGYSLPEDAPSAAHPDSLLVAQVFREQVSLFVEQADEHDPANAELY